MLRAVCGAFADAEEVVGAKALAAGKVAADIVLKPIAIVGGLKAAAVGTGMKVGGGAIKFLGEKMVKDGVIVEATGAGIKGAGLGVAALGVKPLAEKIVAKGAIAEAKVDAVKGVAGKFAKDIGDSSIQIDARIDSPAIGSHSKHIGIVGGETSINEQHIPVQQVVEQQQQLIEQQTTKAKRAAPKIDPDVLKSALSLVKEAKMEDCVSRAICDLNCNPQGFGQDGKQLFMTMVRLQGSKLLEASDAKTFQEAAAKGRQSSGKCEECTTIYAKCSSKSAYLIKMANHIRID